MNEIQFSLALALLLAFVALLSGIYEEYMKHHHEFDTDDIERTGAEDHTRIRCVCRGCGNTFFAHCGLDLPGKLVNLRREVRDRGQR